MIATYRPQTLVLNAGATPPVGSIVEQTWETFSTNWNVDVQHVFNFDARVLRAPRPRVDGRQPVQRGRLGGLADERRLRGRQGRHQAHQLLCRARSSAPRADIRFLSVLPQLTPATGLGKVYTERYAAVAG